jgi:hypothetical protein
VSEERRVAHQLGDLLIERGQNSLEGADVQFEAGKHASVGGVLEPVGLGEEHLLDLLAPCL